MSDKIICVRNINDLPWNYNEICLAEQQEKLLVGVFKDTSRQWLTSSPDAPKYARIILNILLFFSGIGFPIIIVIYSWKYIAYFSLILFVFSFLSYMFARPTTFFNKKIYKIAFVLTILIGLYGILSGTNIIWLISLSLLGPWVLNMLQYRISCDIVRKLVLEDKNIFYHFFKASELEIWDLEQDVKYKHFTDNPLPPKWFLYSYKNKEVIEQYISCEEVTLLKKLPIQDLIIPILMNYRSIYNIKDFISLIPENCLKDISDSEQVKKMNEMYSNLNNHKNKFFQFKESEQTIGELDIDFFEGQLVNVRIKIYFNKIDYKNDYLKNIKVLIEELVSIDLNSKEMSLGYYNFSGRTRNNLVIGIKNLSDSISIAISDGNIRGVFYDN